MGMVIAKNPPIITSAINGEEIRLVENQLKKILASTYFKSAKQMQRFLKFIVEKKIAGEEKGLKQYTIAVEALFFADDFDPDENPVVRIMAGRVRGRLKEYYEIKRNDDEIIIKIPKGRYIPEFKKNKYVKNNVKDIAHASRGPTLALASFSDKTQCQTTNGLLLQATDVLATELSRFLCLQLVVCNPYGDKDQSHLVEIDMKSTDRAEYILALYLQNVDGDEDKSRLVYRLLLVGTGEILWSENFIITGKPIIEQDYVISKITATVADHLQGIMHTHWSRSLLSNVDTIPDYARVLVYFRNYTDSFSRDSFEKVMNACLEAFMRNPNDIVAILIYAELCRHEYVYSRGIIKSPLEKSQKYIEKAILLSPTSNEIRYLYGLQLFYQNNWEYCVEQFKLARSITKNNIVTEYGIGLHYCMMDQWDKGLALVKKAMLLSSNYPSYYHIVPCLYHYRQDKFEEALYEAKKINIPNLVHGSLARCVCYAQLGELDKAEKELHEVLNRCPKFMQRGQKQLIRLLGSKILTEKIWDGVLKASK